jgi:hypothetical protein
VAARVDQVCIDRDRNRFLLMVARDDGLDFLFLLRMSPKSRGATPSDSAVTWNRPRVPR